MSLCNSAQGTVRAGRAGGTARQVVVVSFLVAGCSTVPADFHPEFPIHSTEVSHRLLRDVLSQAVSDGLVDYGKIQRDNRFREYVDSLNRVNPNDLPSKADRLAWWINAYNAFAIQGILDGGTPRPYLGWYQFFKARKYAVGGTKLNLYDLEHGILRREFDEPRVHFAIVCASTSCPRLQPWAYEGAELDRQLDQAAREFLNDPSRNRYDRRHKIAFLSKIFDWFESDFSAAAGTVQAYVSRYVDDPELVRELLSVPYQIRYLEYDWDLNGVPPRKGEHADPS